ncbi:MAG: hypothetical protein M3Z36_14440, partial [Acidobacteriota bacterium]|nr:hypothetical protein [Acidobacteriota bacterium]
KGLAVFWFAIPLLAADGPAVYFSKSFPGSVPAFISIKIDQSGAAEYSEDPKDENPLRFQIAAADVNEIFSLADKLGKFTRPLESPAKVAKMGLKTFGFEKGSEKHEVKFNYSEDADARLLQDWFEKISETEQNLILLERAAKYDKLGVNKALLQLEMSMDRKRLVAPNQMLPMLDRIAKNESFLNMARSRAAGIADIIRAAK